MSEDEDLLEFFVLQTIGNPLRDKAFHIGFLYSM